MRLVRRYDRASGAQCIPRAPRPQDRGRLELALAFHHPDRFVLVAVPALQHAVPDSVTFRVESKKDQ